MADPASPSIELSARRLAPLLRHAWYNLNQAFRRRIAASGATPDQFTVLRWLAEHPEGITQSRLAELMSSDANTIASLIARMEGVGLVERRQDQADRRRQRLRLKAKGLRLHARIQPIAGEIQRDILAAIPRHQLDLFFDHLELMARSCQQVATDGRAPGVSPSPRRPRLPARRRTR
jgi:MarR family transcriptional regulator for hemolysin